MDIREAIEFLKRLESAGFRDVRLTLRRSGAPDDTFQIEGSGDVDEARVIAMGEPFTADGVAVRPVEIVGTSLADVYDGMIDEANDLRREASEGVTDLTP